MEWLDLSLLRGRAAEGLPVTLTKVAVLCPQVPTANRGAEGRGPQEAEGVTA